MKTLRAIVDLYRALCRFSSDWLARMVSLARGLRWRACVGRSVSAVIEDWISRQRSLTDNGSRQGKLLKAATFTTSVLLILMTAACGNETASSSDSTTLPTTSTSRFGSSAELGTAGSEVDIDVESLPEDLPWLLWDLFLTVTWSLISLFWVILRSLACQLVTWWLALLVFTLVFAVFFSTSPYQDVRYRAARGLRYAVPASLVVLVVWILC